MSTYQDKEEGDEEVEALHHILAGQLEQLATVKPFHHCPCKRLPDGYSKRPVEPGKLLARTFMVPQHLPCPCCEEMKDLLR